MFYFSFLLYNSLKGPLKCLFLNSLESRNREKESISHVLCACELTLTYCMSLYVDLTNRDTILSTKEPHLPSQTSHTEGKNDATELNVDGE